jgi:hypothetical protein
MYATTSAKRFRHQPVIKTRDHNSMSAGSSPGYCGVASGAFQTCSDIGQYARFRLHQLGFLQRGVLARESRTFRLEGL